MAANPPRAFDLTHVDGEDLRVACVPFGDLFNHPSAASMRSSPRLLDLPAGALSIRAVRDGEDLAILAPRVGWRDGEELYFWYGNAGFGEEDPAEYHRREAAFAYQYGFSPWAS